jgi:hypothetical protein
MSKDDKELFISRTPDGDYAIRKPGADRASAKEPTQKDAIDRAKDLNPDAAILVQRVRDTKNGDRDKWRKP